MIICGGKSHLKRRGLGQDTGAPIQDLQILSFSILQAPPDMCIRGHVMASFSKLMTMNMRDYGADQLAKVVYVILKGIKMLWLHVLL